MWNNFVEDDDFTFQCEEVTIMLYRFYGGRDREEAYYNYYT